MNIERRTPGFSPVTITLESQLEVDVLHCMAGSVEGEGAARQVADNLFNALNRYIKQTDVFKGSLMTVREDKE